MGEGVVRRAIFVLGTELSPRGGSWGLGLRSRAAARAKRATQPQSPTPSSSAIQLMVGMGTLPMWPFGGELFSTERLRRVRGEGQRGRRETALAGPRKTCSGKPVAAAS